LQSGSNCTNANTKSMFGLLMSLPKSPYTTVNLIHTTL
jgi:hypothetical protein